ncbi:MAG TPA: hypothetical protein VH500_09830 [Nitrososphaeraceae archaeon]|jgi:hypothetical protein
MEREPVSNQFTTEELQTIHEALVFSLNCVEATQGIPPFNKMGSVLAKVDGLLQQVQ